MYGDPVDPAEKLLLAQLAALDRFPPPEGKFPGMNITWAELREECRQYILDEIARYREQKWDALFAQPHVQAGLRRRAREAKRQFAAGETVEGGFGDE